MATLASVEQLWCLFFLFMAHSIFSNLFLSTMNMCYVYKLNTAQYAFLNVSSFFFSCCDI